MRSKCSRLDGGPRRDRCPATRAHVFLGNRIWKHCFSFKTGTQMLRRMIIELRLCDVFLMSLLHQRAGMPQKAASIGRTAQSINQLSNVATACPLHAPTQSAKTDPTKYPSPSNHEPCTPRCLPVVEHICALGPRGLHDARDKSSPLVLDSPRITSHRRSQYHIHKPTVETQTTCH